LMANATKPEPSVSVLAQHVSAHLSVFVVAENTDSKRPANGGLRLLNYPSDEACIADGQRLAGLMTHKHDLYGTGFAGGKIVARAQEPAAVKDELISVTADLLESLDGSMITGCDLNTSLEDMERLMSLTPHVLAAVGSPVDASAATAHGTLGAVEAVLSSDLKDATPRTSPRPRLWSRWGNRRKNSGGGRLDSLHRGSQPGACWLGRCHSSASQLPLVGSESGSDASLLNLRIDQLRDC